MRILITGATGYIGSHVTKQLCEEGHVVHGTDYNLRQNDISKYTEKIIPWDITLKHFGKLYDYDVVLHLAAKTMVELSTKFPKEYHYTNVFGTINLLNTIKNYGHFVYGGTGCSQFAGSSPYATSKKAAEEIISSLPNFSICRFYNVSGNNGYKKFDNSYYHLIRKLAAASVGKFNEVEIFGTDYDTRDGTAIRNYTHIDDIVNSLVRVINNGPTNKIENLGNSTGYSVKEVIAAMESVSGVKLTVIEKPKRQGDHPVTLLNDVSDFFAETKSIQDQCLSSLLFEREQLK